MFALEVSGHRFLRQLNLCLLEFPFCSTIIHCLKKKMSYILHLIWLQQPLQNGGVTGKREALFIY